MRKDMFKVIVERARRGGKWAKKHPAKGDIEELPLRESTNRKRQYGYNCKELNENLKPLDNFLRSRVGQLWNNVYSEICATLKGRNTVQQHVLDHLKYMVKKQVYKSHNRIFENVAPYYRDPLELRFGELYVDPITGYLCKYKFNKYRYRDRRKDIPAWVTGMELLLTQAKGKTTWYNGEVCKVFMKDQQKIYIPATKTHAMHDFNTALYYAWNGLQDLKSFCNKYRLMVPDCEYFKTFIRMVDNA